MNNAPGPPERSYDADRHHSREYINLRDYFERLLANQHAFFERGTADHDAVHRREAEVSQREAALVRTVLEQRMNDHDLRHAEQHIADQRAIGEARDRVEQRLGALNELRAEVTEDRGQLVQRTTYETRSDAIDKEIKAVREDIGLIRQELANQRGRAAAYAVVLGLAVVLIPVLIQFLLRT